jgi:hypothetical protein
VVEMLARPHLPFEVPDTELAQLRAQVAQLTEAMDRRAPIEQAKGALMQQLRCSAEEAFAELVRRSQRSHVKLRDVAVALLAEIPATGERPPSSLTAATGLGPSCDACHSWRAPACRYTTGSEPCPAMRRGTYLSDRERARIVARRCEGGGALVERVKGTVK